MVTLFIDLLTPLLDTKELVLKEFDKHCKVMWDDFGAKPSILELEIETWRYKVVYVGRKVHYSIVWSGIGETSAHFIARKRQVILDALDVPEINIADAKARRAVHLNLCYLWSRELISGPNSSLQLYKAATKAESLAKYLDKLGKDENADKQRARAATLRRIAAGEDLPLPQRAAGVIDKLRALFQSLELDSKLLPRKTYIEAGIKSGVHPGTCAVQYARWKREHK